MSADPCLVSPPPTCYLTEAQARRLACLQAVVAIMAGRGATDSTLWAMARWAETGQEEDET